MSEELKPCPFCGKIPREKSITIPFDVVKERRKVAHCDCGVFLYVGRWNTRPREDALQTEVTQLKERVKELEDEFRWIPVEEALPVEGQTVLICEKDRRIVDTGFYNLHSNQWFWRNGLMTDNVTHWRLKPKPVAEDTKDT